jgi:hypothetical protein
MERDPGQAKVLSLATSDRQQIAKMVAHPHMARL